MSVPGNDKQCGVAAFAALFVWDQLDRLDRTLDHVTHKQPSLPITQLSPMASFSCRRLLRPVWCKQLLTVQPQARQTWKQHAMCMHTAVARRWTVYTSPHARTVGLLQQRHPVHLMHRRHVLTAAVQRRLDTSIQYDVETL